MNTNKYPLPERYYEDLTLRVLYRRLIRNQAEGKKTTLLQKEEPALLNLLKRAHYD